MRQAGQIGASANVGPGSLPAKKAFRNGKYLLADQPGWGWGWGFDTDYLEFARRED